MEAELSEEEDPDEAEKLRKNRPSATNRNGGSLVSVVGRCIKLISIFRECPTESLKPSRLSTLHPARAVMKRLKEGESLRGNAAAVAAEGVSVI